MKGENENSTENATGNEAQPGLAGKPVLTPIEGAVGRWDPDQGSIVFVKINGKWEDGKDSVNLYCDGIHYLFNLEGEEVMVSIDENANFEIGDVDEFEEVE